MSCRRYSSSLLRQFEQLDHQPYVAVTRVGSLQGHVVERINNNDDNINTVRFYMRI